MANIDFLRERALLLRKLRHWFDGRGFFEVHPPCLSGDCVVDTYIEPIAVETAELGLGAVDLAERLFLQTSPELAMKRMLAAGAPSIYALVPVFRGGEYGPLHNVEFTMLEWYEVGGNYESARNLTGKLACDILEIPTYESLSYQDAFQQLADCDPLADSTDRLRERAIHCAPDLEDGAGHPHVCVDRDAFLDVILSYQVAPQLGKTKPTILFDYPITQAALAKTSARDDRCAARFELFIDGVEIANGYDELLDAEELERRTSEHQTARQTLGKRTLPGNPSLIKSMRTGLPACSGVALGVDRLLMLSVGRQSVQDVLPFTTASA
ncbi:MAG: EF-P lysine aminoacylase EpmA [Planctomycetota bacterium]